MVMMMMMIIIIVIIIPNWGDHEHHESPGARPAVLHARLTRRSPRAEQFAGRGAE